MNYCLSVLQSLASMCSEDFGGSLKELWVRAAAAGRGAGAPDVRLGRSHITRRHEAPLWGGTSLYMWRRNNRPCPCSGPQISTGVEETWPPPPALGSPELPVRTGLECEGGGRAELSEGAATMLGSGKTPGSNPREERRTAEAGRRLGKKTLKILSLLILTGTDTKRAIIMQQSEQIRVSQTFRTDFTGLRQRLHLKYCKF